MVLRECLLGASLFCLFNLKITTACRVSLDSLACFSFAPNLICPRVTLSQRILSDGDSFFWLVAAWVKSRAERPSVSGVNRQLHVQIGCKLGIRNRKDELLKQAKRNKLQIKPEGN